MERCAKDTCKKKVFITGECKCGKTFCINHRLPEEHDCTFDFKSVKVKEHKPKTLITHDIGWGVR